MMHLKISDVENAEVYVTVGDNYTWVANKS
jgi:hypothetical protein